MSWLSKAVGKIPVVGGALNAAGKVVDGVANTAIKNLPGGSMALDAANTLGRMIPDPTGNGGGSGGGGPDILQLLAIANAASLQGKSNAYAGDALKTAQSAYDAKAPLRDAGIAGMQFASTHGNPFAAGFTGGSALPLAGGGNGTASPSPVAMPTAEALRMAPSGSSMPSGAPSVGAASVPPSMNRMGDAGPLKIATQNLNRGKPSPGLQRSNDLELQKLYQE